MDYDDLNMIDYVIREKAYSLRDIINVGMLFSQLKSPFTVEDLIVHLNAELIEQRRKNLVRRNVPA